MQVDQEMVWHEAWDYSPRRLGQMAWHSESEAAAGVPPEQQENLSHAMIQAKAREARRLGRARKQRGSRSHKAA